MIKPINLNDESIQAPDWLPSGDTVAESSWISSYFTDFKKRLFNLLGFEFRHLPCSLVF